MKYSRLWVLTAIIAFVILVGFVLSVPHTRDINKPLVPDVETGVPYVTLRDSFKKGMHTITGSLLAPNACASVDALAREDDSSGAGAIVVELSFPDSSGICLQVPTRVAFSTTVSAPAGLPIQVMVNGVAASTTAP